MTAQGKSCTECGEPVEKENLDVGIFLCKKCDEKNWSNNPAEIVEALSKDPKFQLGIVSPIQRENI